MRSVRAVLAFLIVSASGCGRSGPPVNGAIPTESIPIPTPTPVDGEAFAFRTMLAVDTAGMAAALADFPLVVRVPGSIAAQASTDGRDVRVVALGTFSPLPVEIENWSADGGVLWVRAPLIGPGGFNRFWMLHGNPDVPDGQDPAGLWSQHSAVWHLQDLRCSTTCPALSGGALPDAGGAAGGAFRFDPALTQHLAAPDDPSLNPTEAVTVSAWFYSTRWSGGNRRVLQKGNGDDQYRVYTNDPTIGPTRFRGDVSQVAVVTADSVPAEDTWHSVVLSADASEIRLFIDGALVGSGTGGDLPITGDPFHIGTKNESAPSGDHFEGLIDEVRIAPVARTGDWIAIDHRNLMGDLVIVGPTEPND